MYSKAYRDAHREALKARRHAYYVQNKARSAATCRAYYVKHREQIVTRAKGYRERSDKARRAAYDTAYRAANSERIRARQNAWYEQNKPVVIARAAAWRKENPELTRQQGNAHMTVRRALQAGLLVRPDRCTRCERECRPHAHHFLGYDADARLAVVWLCISCHAKAHRERSLDERSVTAHSTHQGATP